MAWTELHDSLPDHPKTKVLVAELGSTKPHAIGLLCALWCFTLRFGKDGSITRKYWRGLAADMGEKDPDATLAALETAGWVTTSGDNITCHDWDDYAGRLEEIRRKDREEKRRKRELRKMSEGHRPTSEGNPATSPPESTGESDQPNLTKPNLTKPTTLPDSDESVGEGGNGKHHNYSPRFEAFWQFFPRKIGKGKAWAVFRRLGVDDQSAAVEQAEAYAQAYEMAPDQRRQYFKHPATWLNARSWEDDHAEWSLLIEGK